MENNNVEQRKRRPLGRGVRKLGINIVDSPMGFGKTSWAINKINSDKNQNFIYITPFLSEIDRVKNSCKDRKFTEPKVGKARNKLESLKQLVLKDKNKEEITLKHSHNSIFVFDNGIGKLIHILHQRLEN